jgi:hypothetical protein
VWIANPQQRVFLIEKILVTEEDSPLISLRFDIANEQLQIGFPPEFVFGYRITNIEG